MLHKLNFSPFPNLATQRLVLRQLTTNDAEEIMKLRSNEQVNKYLVRPKTIGLSDAKKFIEKIENGISNNQWIYWAITLKENNILTGTICLWNISIENNIAELGYELHPAFQGKGLMREAIVKVIDYCFNTIQLKVITGFVHAANSKSIKLLQKNNFVLDENYTYAQKEDGDKLLVYYLTKPV